MTRDEVIRILKANIDRRVLVTFVDGAEQSVMVTNLDRDGFVNQVGNEYFWATFDDVAEVHPKGDT